MWLVTEDNVALNLDRYDVLAIEEMGGGRFIIKAYPDAKDDNAYDAVASGFATADEAEAVLSDIFVKIRGGDLVVFVEGLISPKDET